MNMNNKPGIYITYYNASYLLQEVLAGIEEESVPYQIEEKKIDQILSAAKESALCSKLGIGVAISNRDIVITIDQLKDNQPLYHIQSCNQQQARLLGMNSARYVKGLPLKTSR